MSYEKETKTKHPENDNGIWLDYTAFSAFLLFRRVRRVSSLVA